MKHARPLLSSGQRKGFSVTEPIGAILNRNCNASSTHNEPSQKVAQWPEFFFDVVCLHVMRKVGNENCGGIAINIHMLFLSVIDAGRARRFNIVACESNISESLSAMPNFTKQLSRISDE